jgi:hypothetical protein
MTVYALVTHLASGKTSITGIFTSLELVTAYMDEHGLPEHGAFRYVAPFELDSLVSDEALANLTEIDNMPNLPGNKPTFTS